MQMVIMISSLNYDKTQSVKLSETLVKLDWEQIAAAAAPFFIEVKAYYSNICFTPGHTPGHISLYFLQSKTLVAGDAVVIENGVLDIANPQFALDLEAAV